MGEPTNNLEIIRDGFFTLDNELVVTYVDKVAAQLLGYKTDELLGRNLFERFPLAKGSLFEEQCTRSIKENSPAFFETVFGAKPHQNLYDIRIYPDKTGLSVYLHLAAERKQMEAEREQLLATEHKQRLRAETLAEATLALTSQISLATVLDEILRQVQRLVPYRTAHIVLLEGDSLRIASWQGYQARGSEELISHLVQPLADFPLDSAVVQSRQPLVVADTHQEPRWVVQEETAWVRSHVVVPICLKDQVLGLLRLDAATPNKFSTKDVTALQPLVNAAVIALENARLYDQARQEISERKRAEEALQDSVQQLNIAYEQASIYAQELNKEIAERKQAQEETLQRNRELELLNRIIAASAKGLEPDAILQIACQELAGALKVPQAVATLLNDDKTTMTVVAKYLAEDRLTLLDDVIPIEDTPTFQYLLNYKAPLVVNDAQNDSRLTPVRDLLRQSGINSLLILPLIIDSDVVGSLGLEDVEARSFSATELNLAWSVAEQVAGVLARARLAQTRTRLTTAIEQAGESVVIADTEGSIVYVNPAFERITGYDYDEAIGQNMVNLLKSDRQDAAIFQEMWATIRKGHVWHGRLVNKKIDGTLYTEDVSISPVRSESGSIVNYVAVKRDVTHELQLEEQYRQAQKMEAIGLLAGGIAHDFNNLLTAINGFAEMIQFELPPEELVLQKLAGNIQRAGKRATDLVRQLLAFSRKQIIEPRVLDLNTVVPNMGKMLERLIGEHIEMTMVLAPKLWLVKVDPAQIEQLIVNLVVNAHDAMPDGGRLIIETSNAALDDQDVADRLGIESGEYVFLSVSDTGIGMSKEVQTHIFEPFFTTKEQGKGTGLGLSTVFGIVKQNGGHIFVYSEPGQGTTFKIYFPRTKEPVDTGQRRSKRDSRMSDLPRGTETILLAEDEPAVRELAARVLQRQGYTVLEASNGVEALTLTEKHPQEIHILLTDTVMPKMSGEALAEQFRNLRPTSKILFTSGYSDKVVMFSDVLGSDIDFLQKPFSAVELARKVRAVLDS